MNRILIPSNGPSDWRSLLGDPEKHWKRGRSALEIAVSWELAERAKGIRGFPSEVARVLDSVPALMNAELLLAVPEHKVTLNDHRAPSQTDVWALLRNENGFISLAVEAKAGESFDKTVTEWLNQPKPRKGRESRLEWLCSQLRTDAAEQACGSLRYQLFHRTVVAVKEAKRWRATAAVMLVQAFPGADVSWTDFEQFGNYLGVRVEKEKVVQVPSHEQPQLYLGWVVSDCASDAQIAATVATQAMPDVGK